MTSLFLSQNTVEKKKTINSSILDHSRIFFHASSLAEYAVGMSPQEKKERWAEKERDRPRDIWLLLASYIVALDKDDLFWLKQSRIEKGKYLQSIKLQKKQAKKSLASY